MSQPLVTGIDHVQVACPAGSEDLLRSFYVGVLGMTERVKPPVLAARGGAWFRCGTAEIHCGVEDPFTPARKAHPGIAVSDIDRAATVCAEAGLPVTWDEVIPGLRRFHTVDPVGNRIEPAGLTGAVAATLGGRGVRDHVECAAVRLVRAACRGKRVVSGGMDVPTM